VVCRPLAGRRGVRAPARLGAARGSVLRTLGAYAGPRPLRRRPARRRRAIRPCPARRSYRPGRCRRRRRALPFQAGRRWSRCGRQNRRPEWSDFAAAGLRRAFPQSAVVEVDPQTAARHCGPPPLLRRAGPRGRSQTPPLAAVTTSFDAPTTQTREHPRRAQGSKPHRSPP
jgi:hypothetical protein